MKTEAELLEAEWGKLVDENMPPELNPWRRAEIVRFIVHGEQPSKFVWLMFKLRLNEAIAANGKLPGDCDMIPAYVKFIWEVAPGECFGEYTDAHPWQGLAWLT